MMITNPVRAIRAKCLDCCCGSANEVKECPSETCSLHPFRFGKNPYRAKRELSPEQRAAMRERLLRARDAKQSTTVTGTEDEMSV